ncbi:MAG: ribonucleoside triphosphate reductase [Alphaproteobacteria bacterium]|nr:ribonucleoside triphosphate reductase [Alphaproteobacteria bacterium]MBQ6855313.1 ribonucleoside triphosphate reductase [Alphaproteobacteria bacterium]
MLNVVQGEDKSNIDLGPLTEVIKRDGEKHAFDASKIAMAITRAGEATNEFSSDEAWLLTRQVIKVLKHKFAFGTIPAIEQIQDVVEQVLISSNYYKTARSYIVYREQRDKMRKDKHAAIDAISSINEYLDRSDWRVNANANQGYSLGGLILNVSGKVVANYWLNHVYTPEIGEAHRNGDYHIHDLDMLSGYCAGWSLRVLLTEGFNGVPNKVESKPPRHLVSAFSQMINFLGTLQNEWAGAQAFSSADTYLAPFVRIEKLTYEEVKQAMQSFVFNLNVPSRWGTQTPFTNLTFDWTCPEDLKDRHPIIGGEEQDFTYGELQTEMDMINRAFLEVMGEGDAKGRPFTFPIPTYNITNEFPWDSPNTEYLFEMTAKYGLPYFSNYLNSDMKPSDVRSMCCRLRLDLTELKKRGGGLFGSAEQTGSIGVVTINCARLGYLYKGNKKELYKRLDELLELAKTSLEIKRKTISMHMDRGLYPYTRRYLGTFRNHFSTIGVNGINEMIRNFSYDAENITTENGRIFAQEFLTHIREKMLDFQAETGNMYNLEATPAEGTTYRFAREDQKRYSGIIQAGTKEAPYYTNSSQLPAGFTDDPFTALDYQDDLQTQYTGGTVLHLYMSERISSSAACKSLVKRVLENYRLPYVSITPVYSICPKHGYIAGEHKYCPHCDKELIEKKRREMEAQGNI